MSTKKGRNVDSLFSIAVEYIVNNLPIYEKSHLESLQMLPSNVKNRLLKKFTSTSYFSRNVKITSFLTAFVNNQTTHINLTSVYVTDEMLDILCSCKNLKRLYLTRDGDNCKITAKGLINLLQNTPNIEDLIIMRCDEVNDDVLKCISINCQKLRGLDIGGCINVTDTGLKFLSDMAICWLRISKTQVTDEGISALVDGKCGQTLAELMIDDCVNVTHVGLSKITQCCPNLTIFNFINCNTDIKNDSFFFLDVLATDFLEFKQPPKQLFWQIPF